jgi:hypothetical protein
MSDSDSGPTLTGLVQGVLYDGFGLAIESGGGFVENENLCGR